MKLIQIQKQVNKGYTKYISDYEGYKQEIMVPDSHEEADYAAAKLIKDNIGKYVARGLKVEITEIETVKHTIRESITPESAERELEGAAKEADRGSEVDTDKAVV